MVWKYFLPLCCFSYHSLNTFMQRTVLISLLQFSCSVMSDSLWPYGLQHARLPCLLPAPGSGSNSYPSSQWCHPTISSSVVPFSNLQFFPSSRSFQMSHLFAWGGQSTGVSASASVLPINIQDWFPLELTGLISLQSRGLSGVFNNKVPSSQSYGFSTSHVWMWELDYKES